jgi:hypothetical protein
MRWFRSHSHIVFSAGKDSIIDLSQPAKIILSVVLLAVAETVNSVGETDREDEHVVWLSPLFKQLALQ